MSAFCRTVASSSASRAMSAGIAPASMNHCTGDALSSRPFALSPHYDFIAKTYAAPSCQLGARESLSPPYARKRSYSALGWHEGLVNIA